jgi:uncharacterized RDD family membrane protein YckC
MDKYETVWRRFWASVLDSIILWITGWLVLLITPSLILPLILSGAISVCYYVLMHNAYGQTIGKMAARVKVLDISEIPINLGQSITRSLPQLIPVMFVVSFSTADSAKVSAEVWFSVFYGFKILFTIADIIICLSTQKRRALHDFIAGTIVVKTNL